MLSSHKGDFAGAVAKYRHALTFDPHNTAVWDGLASCLHAQGDYPSAIVALCRTLAIAHDDANAHRNLALMLLLHDEYPEGWKEFEWRWKCASTSKHPLRTHRPGRPLWNGENLVGRTILLIAEKGFGDMFQCLRYVPMIVARGARVVLIAGPDLRCIAANMPEVNIWPLDRAAWPACDVYCPMMSLPRIFCTTIKTIPAAVPYLTADPTVTVR